MRPPICVTNWKDDTKRNYVLGYFDRQHHMCQTDYDLGTLCNVIILEFVKLSYGVFRKYYQTGKSGVSVFNMLLVYFLWSWGLSYYIVCIYHLGRICIAWFRVVLMAYPCLKFGGDIKNNAWVTVNNDFLVTSGVISQWFSRATKSRVKIIGKSHNGWPKNRYSR